MSYIYWLRLKRFMAMVISGMVYFRSGYSWWLLIFLLFVPDISMLVYLKNKKRGVTIYNLFHAYIRIKQPTGFKHTHLGMIGR